MELMGEESEKIQRFGDYYIWQTIYSDHVAFWVSDSDGTELEHHDTYVGAVEGVAELLAEDIDRWR